MKPAQLRLEHVGDVLTPIEVQHVLGIGRNAAYGLLESGRLGSGRITPRRIIMTKRAVEELLGVATERTARQG